MKIHEALAEVMKAIPVVAKKDRNTQGKGYDFRGIDAVLNAVGPQLRNFGVVILPQVLAQEQEVLAIGQNRTQMQFVTLTVQYTFIGPEGDKLSVVVPGQAGDVGDKAYPKAMSVALRTALIQTLALPTDEPDPDEYSYERAAPADPADTAREALLDKIARLGLNPKDVNQQYVTQHKVRIPDETNADRLNEFTKTLEKPSE